ncbi:hypothetical protein PCANB_000795 [Pneumocystis canis]|nr:hypothetical protein PCK1_000780 [Pneumocystis canis]KAG5437364.1 hypothetical protein PCANB_000795 [Pneumocystis canis]
MLSLNSLQSLLQAYPDLTSISLLLIILYISLYILGRTFRKFKIFLRMAVLSAVVTCVIYILLNGMESAQAKFDNIKTHVRELAFLLIDKKHAQKSRR